MNPTDDLGELRERVAREVEVARRLCPESARMVSPSFCREPDLPAARPRALLADGDAVRRACYGHTLTAACGCDVEAVGSALDCVARLRRSRFDLLVLDAALPWGGGLGVLAALADEGRAAPPVIYLAGVGAADAPPGVEVVRGPLTPRRLASIAVRAIRRDPRTLPARPAPSQRHWTADEVALLASLTDEELAARTGRSPDSVRALRSRRGIPRAE
jgi:CheY-like chemotaxis protein